MNLPDKLTLEVSEEDIVKGECGAHNLCAVALAVLRAFPDTEWVSVLYDQFTIEGAQYNNVDLRQSAWVESFDELADIDGRTARLALVQPTTLEFVRDEDFTPSGSYRDV